MSALAGFWSHEGRESVRSACARMLNAQSVYAPDAERVWSEGPVGIGRRLFQTLPEDRNDRGPVIGGGGRFALVADIRLDNRDELASALGIEAPALRGLADAPLLMRALERWEEAALQRLVGDFAFALWDGARNRLLLARDFLGQRPLHYHVSKGFAAFASMPKGLHAIPAVPYEPDLAAVADFLALMPESGSGTFFRGVEKVQPGHIVTITAGGVSARKYWRPDLSPLRLKRPADYEEAVREQMDLAVASRLRGSNGRIGSHLSAGLDSSAVTATAARLLAPSGGRVTAFTSVPRAGYEGSVPAERMADEWPLASATAAAYANIEHVAVSAGGRSPFENLDRHFFLADRPILNLVNFPWWDAIHDRAKEMRLGIVLTGIMGNMSFSHGGMDLLPQLLAKGRLLPLARIAAQLSRNGVRWGSIGAQTLGPFLPGALWRGIGRLRGRGWDIGRYSALRASAITEMGVEARAAARGLDPSYRPRADGVGTRLWVLGRADPGNYNKAVLGGWGIDSRDPTADRRLVELCLRIPGEEYLRGGVVRGLARRAFADRLPEDVVRETRKGYQAVDWHEGLTAHRDALIEEVARIAACGPAAGLLDVERARRLIEDWPSGGWNRHRTVHEYRLALLRGIAAGHFVRKAIGTNA